MLRKLCVPLPYWLLYSTILRFSNTASDIRNSTMRTECTVALPWRNRLHERAIVTLYVRYLSCFCLHELVFPSPFTSPKSMLSICYFRLPHPSPFSYSSNFFLLFFNSHSTAVPVLNYAIRNGGTVPNVFNQGTRCR
jgi:hypothetical protein